MQGLEWSAGGQERIGIAWIWISHVSLAAPGGTPQGLDIFHREQKDVSGRKWVSKSIFEFFHRGPDLLGIESFGTDRMQMLAWWPLYVKMERVTQKVQAKVTEYIL